jgi:hypothetical protein
MSLGFTILSVIHVVPMMTGFLNPEFGALQTIAEIYKNNKDMIVQKKMSLS